MANFYIVVKHIPTGKTQKITTAKWAKIIEQKQNGSIYKYIETENIPGPSIQPKQTGLGGKVVSKAKKSCCN